MRAIVKRKVPRSLTEHRLKKHSNYGNYANKDDLRHALVREQRGLCCYCMGQISSDSSSMKIEHWQCISQYPKEQLNYRNLLAACLGDEGKPRHLQHCDTRKGNCDLKWNPADRAHYIETRIRYEPSGSILSDDAKFDAQLTEVLNLNLPLLKNNRKAVLDGFLGWWKQEGNKLRGSALRARIEQERDRITSGTGKLNPYCQIAVWWLEQRLERMPS